MTECLSLFKQLFHLEKKKPSGDGSADSFKEPSFLQRSVDVRLFSSPQDSQEKNANPVKAEEAKLKAKYPGLGQKPGGSDFLMKRLQKGVCDRGLFTTSSGGNQRPALFYRFSQSIS